MSLSGLVKLEEGQAIVKLIEGEKVYSKHGDFWYKEGDTIYCNNQGDIYPSAIAVVAFIRKTTDWYVKKPFDVRAEMLARPNEWVGAFKDEDGWWKVGFNRHYMTAVTIDSKFEGSVIDFPSRGVDGASLAEIHACIPIEDVTTEELK